MRTICLYTSSTQHAKGSPEVSLDLSGYDIDRNLGFLISDLHRLITTAMDKELKALSLTRSQLRVVLHLTRGQGLTQVRIAEDLEMGKVAVGGLLDRLEAKDLIERRPHPTDRRASSIFLTAKSDALHKPILKSGGYVSRQMVANISSKDQERLVDLLLMVKQNTQALLSDTERDTDT
jgi:MarR family transcriptional regulator for hemolysin